MTRKKSFCLIGIPGFLLLLAAEARPQETSIGTPVVIVRSQGEIMIAADSRTVPLTGAPGPADTGAYCLVRALENVGAAFAGLVRDTSTRFDVAQIARAACRGEGTIVEKFTRFDVAVGPKLGAAWAALYPDTTDPRRIQSLEVAFCGMFEGMGIVLIGKYTRDVQRRVVRMFRLPHSAELSSVQFFFLGEKDEFVHHIRRTDAPGSGEFLATSLALLQSDWEAARDAGGPVDVLQMTVAGQRWVQRSSACQGER